MWVRHELFKHVASIWGIQVEGYAMYRAVCKLKALMKVLRKLQQENALNIGGRVYEARNVEEEAQAALGVLFCEELKEWKQHDIIPFYLHHTNSYPHLTPLFLVLFTILFSLFTLHSSYDEYEARTQALQLSGGIGSGTSGSLGSGRGCVELVEEIVLVGS
ncbi:hypothetical protein Droror1_Dr00012285 [Drosera rotundifolia]